MNPQVIKYWCIRCGSDRQYIDCGGFDVHLPCLYCGTPTRFTKDKYAAICSLESHFAHLSIQIGRLVGLTSLKDIVDKRTLLDAIADWKKGDRS